MSQETKEIKTVPIVTSVSLTDYVLVIKDGELSKIKVTDLKQSIK